MLPAALRSEAPVVLHRFGEGADDLRVDFSAGRPELISHLLACCLRTRDGASVTTAWADELSISARIVCLLLLTSLEGRDELDLVLRCPSCTERFELTLAIDEALAFAPAEPDVALEVEIDGGTLSLRRPTGADQQAWSQAGYLNEEYARLGVLRSLLLTAPATGIMPSSLQQLEQLLEEHDPMVCFTLEAVCPFCDATSAHEVPLTDLALRELQLAQNRLLETVHRLAARYGWSEAEVLAVPAWRRARYLALIEAETR
jgi:hypothetical protein